MKVKTSTSTNRLFLKQLNSWCFALFASLCLGMALSLPLTTEAQTPLQLCIDACFETYGKPSAEFKSCVAYCQKNKGEDAKKPAFSDSNQFTKSGSNLEDIVLGVSLDPSEKQFRFPCSASLANNVVFCGGPLALADQTCASSLKFSKIAPNRIEISCQQKNGKIIALAQTRGQFVLDKTQDAFGFVQLKFNPKVNQSMFKMEKL